MGDLLSVTGPGGSGDSVPMATAGGGPLHGQPSLDSVPPPPSGEAWKPA